MSSGLVWDGTALLPACVQSPDAADSWSDVMQAVVCWACTQRRRQQTWTASRQADVSRPAPEMLNQALQLPVRDRARMLGWVHKQAHHMVRILLPPRTLSGIHRLPPNMQVLRRQACMMAEHEPMGPSLGDGATCWRMHNGADKPA